MSTLPQERIFRDITWITIWIICKAWWRGGWRGRWRRWWRARARSRRHNRRTRSRLSSYSSQSMLEVGLICIGEEQRRVDWSMRILGSMQAIIEISFRIRYIFIISLMRGIQGLLMFFKLMAVIHQLEWVGEILRKIRNLLSRMGILIRSRCED